MAQTPGWYYYMDKHLSNYAKLFHKYVLYSGWS